MDVNAQWSEVRTNSMHENGLDREVNLIENDVDARPIGTKVHQFYFVKLYEDQQLKARIEKAEKLLQTAYDDLCQTERDIEGIKFDEYTHRTFWRDKCEESDLRFTIDCKKYELKSLQDALKRQSYAKNASRGTRTGLCSLTKDYNKEHNDLKIQKSHYLMLHESNNLVEEKKILKEIKELEGTRKQELQATMEQQLEGARENDTFDAAPETTYWQSLVSRKTIRDHIKLKETELDVLRKRQCKVRAKIISGQLELEDKKVSLEKKMNRLYQQTGDLRDYIYELKKQNDASNARYYKYLSVMNIARELAEKKDLAALEKLSRKEASKFMFQWSSNDAFKKDYEKRIVQSLDQRQLSRDGLSKTPKRSLRLQRLHQNIL